MTIYLLDCYTPPVALLLWLTISTEIMIAPYPSMVFTSETGKAPPPDPPLQAGEVAALERQTAAALQALQAEITTTLAALREPPAGRRG